jgi:hypothetical protein
MSGNITFYYEDDTVDEEAVHYSADDPPGTTYYKAVRYDYGSFYDPAFKYGPVGTVVKHPRFVKGSPEPYDYISVSVSAADCTGFEYMSDGLPSRLLVVEPIGETWIPDVYDLPNKRAVTTLKIVDELPIHMAFGPNGAQVLNFIDWFDANSATRNLDEYLRKNYIQNDQGIRNDTYTNVFHVIRRCGRMAAHDAAQQEAYWAAHNTYWAAHNTYWAAMHAVLALVVRDLISKADFDVLVEPMRVAGYDFEEEK